MVSILSERSTSVWHDSFYETVVLQRVECIGLWSLKERWNRADVFEVKNVQRMVNHELTLIDSSRTRSHTAKLTKADVTSV